jgi:hypothetical protein
MKTFKLVGWVQRSVTQRRVCICWVPRCSTQPTSMGLHLLGFTLFHPTYIYATKMLNSSCAEYTNDYNDLDFFFNAVVTDTSSLWLLCHSVRF